MQITLSPACFEGVPQDEVPEGHTGFPNTLAADPRLTHSGLGLLMELISRRGEFDIEDAKRAEATRRRQGVAAEDIDGLLVELAEAGYITVPEE